MTRRLKATVATAVACTLALVAGVAVLVHDSGEPAPDTTVLGRTLRRTTTTASYLAAPATAIGPVADEPTTTTAPPAEAATTTSTADVPPAAERPTTTVTIRQVVERADNASAFDYLPDGGGATNSPSTTADRDPFLFNAYGSDVDHDGVAELRADMTNQTDREIAFPGGLVLRFVLSRDGAEWRTVELKFADQQALPPNGSVEIESATPLDAYGHYAVTAEATVEYR